MRKKFIFLILFIVFLVGSSVFAESVTIFGNDNKPPKNYLENGQPKGILIDIMHYIEKEMGADFNIDLYPWSRSYALATEGKGGIIGLSMTKERLKIFDYSDVMLYNNILMVVKKGDEFTYNSVEDLQGKTLGALRGGKYGDDFERGRNGIFTLSEDGSGVQRLKKLLAGRIDVAFISPGLAGFERVVNSDSMLLSNKDNFTILSVPFKKDPNYFGIAKSLNMTSFIEKFNAAMEKGYKDGTIPRIIKSYMN